MEIKAIIYCSLYFKFIQKEKTIKLDKFRPLSARDQSIIDVIRKLPPLDVPKVSRLSPPETCLTVWSCANYSGLLGSKWVM